MHKTITRDQNKFTQNIGLDLGIVTGKIYYYREKNKIWFAGGYFSKLKCGGYHFDYDKYDNTGEEEIKEISIAAGCLWFLPSSVVEEVGYLPEEYFLYVEDTDYCLRLQQHGYKIIYISKAKIWHKAGASSGSTKQTPKYYWMNRNRIILCKKYFGTLKAWFFALGFLIPTRVMRFLQFLLRGKIVNTFEGIYDGLRFPVHKD